MIIDLFIHATADSLSSDIGDYICYLYRDTLYHITVECGGECAEPMMLVTLDGAVVNGANLIPWSMTAGNTRWWHA